MSNEENKNLRTAYQQICDNYRAIDDFRAKLLGFLPLATGGIFLLINPLSGEHGGDFTEKYLPFLGLFGVAVTLGLFCYELFGIKKCHALIEAGRQIEGRLGIGGHFLTRPRAVAGFINEPFAAGVIYPAVLAAWTYLALTTRYPKNALLIAIDVFFGGLVISLMYNLRLGNDVVEEVFEDIEVLYAESTNGAGSSPEVYDKLRSRLRNSGGSKIYRILGEPNGTRGAFVYSKPTDDPKDSKVKMYIIPQGAYARRGLKNWKKRTWEIQEAFDDLRKQYRDNLDSKRPGIEFYKSDEELFLFLPIRHEVRVYELTG